MQREIISDFVGDYICNQRRCSIEYRLYAKKHLVLQKEIFKGMNKRLQCNFDCLLSAFAGAMYLKVIRRAI